MHFPSKQKIHFVKKPKYLKIDIYGEAALSCFISLVLCDNLGGWDGGVGGRPKREGIRVYIQLIPTLVQQKLTQHCEAIILQIKIKKKI